MIFDPVASEKLGKIFAKLKQRYSPYEILNMATANNAELIKMCGPRYPYSGKLGAIEEGALADMILVDGNPLENIYLVADPHNKFVTSMKDGKIYKTPSTKEAIMETGKRITRGLGNKPWRI